MSKVFQRNHRNLWKIFRNLFVRLFYHHISRWNLFYHFWFHQLHLGLVYKHTRKNHIFFPGLPSPYKLNYSPRGDPNGSPVCPATLRRFRTIPSQWNGPFFKGKTHYSTFASKYLYFEQPSLYFFWFVESCHISQSNRENQNLCMVIRILFCYIFWNCYLQQKLHYGSLAYTYFDWMSDLWLVFDVV